MTDQNQPQDQMPSIPNRAWNLAKALTAFASDGCRTVAKATYRINHIRHELAKRGIEILSAGSDEVPGVYKDIHAVMAAQQDLVEIVAQFDPRIVRMCDDGSRAED